MIMFTPPATSESGITGLQAAAGQMHADQRGGTRRVQSDARTLQAQRIRNPVGNNAEGLPGGGMHGNLRARLASNGFVVVPHYPHEEARAAASQNIWFDACILQGFPGQFESQPLLGVHLDGFARRNSEKARVKLVNTLQQAGHARVHLAGLAEIRIVPRIDVPAVRCDFAESRTP